MIGVLMPTRWYRPTAAANPRPCRWEGWLNLGVAGGGVRWVVVELVGL